VLALDLTSLDIDGADSVDPYVVMDLGTPVDRLVATEDGGALLATAGDRLLIVDPSTGQTLSDVERPGLAQAEDAGSGTAIVATPAAMDDKAAVAQELGDLLAGDALVFEERLSSGADRITLGGLENADRDVMEEAISAGDLPGIELVPVDEVLVADGNGVAFLDRATGDELWNLPVAGGAHGPREGHADRRRQVLRDGGNGGGPDVRRDRAGQEKRCTGAAHQQHVSTARAGQPDRLRRADAPGPHPRPNAGWHGLDRVRRGAARQRRLRRRAAALRPEGVGLRCLRGPSQRRPPAAPRLRR
jgi:hypothetical protein